ncbi:MAG: recombinase family protein [Dehalococcoidia bacterium]
MKSDHDHRISPEHLAREAVVYVRQSTVEQVRNNTESTRLQIGLREKAIALGWPDPTIVDDDLGVSAGGYGQRPGFRNLLTRVAMREIGIILCVDASRLSRNSKDWAHLFELCSYFDTLIADADQIYDLALPNDRLVIGIKGTVTEMELRLIRSRLWSGTEAKATRGELCFNLPIGYVHDAEGKITLDPDKRVQQAIRTMFEQFKRCTSVRQLVMWYRDQAVVFPIRRGQGKSRVCWEVPRSRTIYNLLLHPLYTGAYVWGRRATRVEYLDGQLVKRVCESRPVEEARVCLRDHHPAYITWEQHLAIREKIAQNRPRWKMQENTGAIREGLALLAGILRCGRCGGKIYVQYKATSALYYCDGGQEKGSRRCGSFGSRLIDERVSEEILRACSPLGMEAACKAFAEREREYAAALQTARLAVQAAQYEADRAFEQFDLCDPKNRLVADTLEERLNETLARLKAAKDRLHEEESESQALTEADREKLQELAERFPDVWSHPEAEPKLKKNIIRTAIHEVLVSPCPEECRLDIMIHWQGGTHTQTEVPLRRRARGGPADSSLIELVTKIATELSDAEIARILNMKRLTTPRGLPWTQERVNSFRKQHRIRAGASPRGPDVLTQSEALAYLDISRNAFLALVRRGVVAPNQITDFAPWKVSKSELDGEPIQAMVRTLKATGRLPKGGSPKGQGELFDQAKRT